ncbi:hypothetical protein CEF21_03915 [Bacillus sp. FJAT-42376]|uniref:hypothetical protein n=1 Tax=Bacillus sp. FJAT-42376 TaxID=2014076 RepID=UPI000F4E7714|nr:hypothetical protein [Bacillus sp. FJAT-42376]AZB41510.1 hypothetical protein CEF21_03915 [Bacillus sp. FJAT-42376]
MAKFSKLDIGYLIIAALSILGFIFRDYSDLILKSFAGIFAIYSFLKALDVYKTDKKLAAVYAFTVVITTVIFAFNIYNLINS